LQALEVARRSLDNLATRLCGSSEGDLADTRVCGKCCASLAAVACHHIDHPFRQAGIHHQLREAQHSESGVFGRFQHACAARRERRTQDPPLPSQRPIPRNDAADHAEGGLVIKSHDATWQRVLARRRCRSRGARSIELDQLGDPLDHSSGARERSSHIHRLEDRKLLGVLQKQIVDPEQQSLPLVRSSVAPLPFERPSCRRHGPVHISGTTPRKLRNNGAVRRVVDVELFAGCSGDPVATN
jgi:hypothetical protein